MIDANELCDKPGVIIIGDEVIKTTKVKKWILKNKPSVYDVKYVENPSNDFKEVERQLQFLVNDVKGITYQVKEKELFKPPEEEYKYFYKYRANINTVYMAPTKESLLKALNDNGITVNVDELYEV